MIEWLKEKFSSIIGIFYIITVILVSIMGAVLGFSVADSFGCVLGLIIGVFVGIFLGILTFGFFATIIDISNKCNNLNKKIEELRSLLYNSSSNSSSASSSSQYSSSASTISSGYKICKKCGTKNSVNTMMCKDCGEYL